MVRYIISGGAAVVLNFAVLYSLTEFLHIWYLFSSLVGMGAGFITSFLLQKFWTFTNHSLERVHVQFQLHIALSLANVALSTATLYLLVQYAHLWYIAAQFLIAACLATMNYFIYRAYIFPHTHPTSNQALQ